VIPDLDFIEEDVREYLEKKDIKRKVWKGESLAEFSSRAHAISLIFREKEIILLAVLQWARSPGLLSVGADPELDSR
jgi:hypothetical protein